MGKSAADAAKGVHDGAAPEGGVSALPKGLAKLSRQDRAKLRLNHIGKMRPVRLQVAEAQDRLKALKKVLQPLRDAYQGDGFSLANLDKHFKAEDRPRRENQALEQDRHELAEDTGQVVYQQQDLFDRMPEEAKSEKYWSEEGYHAGICDLPPNAPEGIPQRFVQVWTKQYHAGREKVAWAMAESANPEKTETGVQAQPLRLVGDEPESTTAKEPETA